ncbi:type VI secretion system baseplate subunit TssE [uncultured Rhodoblastus sp.]|uniref:type VI secretion system baseplate subunit TssE n=1 Tax=uncultured Rhodoblastus sp. TaxID=543037 RepID=UPI0025FC2D38|nr:type VI secretion system baseplate subunit TssE [uncultured Rhodoblastus sp.]
MFAFRSAHEQKDAKHALDLRDQGGERVIASRRIAVRFAITEMVLRREVKHDLEQLMNAIALESTQDLGPFPAVKESILNYGIPDMAHRTIDEAGVAEVTREIEFALARYEPRLLRNTIKVHRDDNADKTALKLRFSVQGDLICNPINVPVEFVADVEYDSGKITLSRL